MQIAVHPNIKFTVELEDNKAINFLDLHISHINDKFQYNIYRIPTHTDITKHPTFLSRRVTS